MTKGWGLCYHRVVPRINVIGGGLQAIDKELCAASTLPRQWQSIGRMKNAWNVYALTWNTPSDFDPSLYGGLSEESSTREVGWYVSNLKSQRQALSEGIEAEA